MLSPDLLDKIPDNLISIYEELDLYVIHKLSSMIAGGGVDKMLIKDITDASYRTGQRKALDEIQQEIIRSTGLAEKEVQGLFSETVKYTLNQNAALYAGVGKQLERFATPQMEQWLKAEIMTTSGLLRNFTKTMGFSINTGGRYRNMNLSDAYVYLSDLAYTKTKAGVASYQDAVNESVQLLSDSGLRVVSYSSGWNNHVDVAVRRAVLGGTKELSRQITEQNAKGMGTTVFEISWHSGARPSHAWGGMRYDTTGKHYPTPERLFAANGGGETGDYGCRHDIFPVVDVDAPYAVPDARKIEPVDIEYNGRTLNAYDQTQMQRLMERKIRAQTRKVAGQNGAGFDAAAEKKRLAALRAEYKQFSMDAGLRAKWERTHVVA